MLDSVIVSLIIALANMSFYFFLDPLLRKDAIAKSPDATEHDKGTTRFIGVAFFISWFLLLLAALLDHLQIGLVESHHVFVIIGFVLMGTGVTLRVVAMRTLGKFFTRTLQMRKAHRVVSTGVYRHLRHPGYLGDIVLFAGSGIATSNAITTILILGVILPAFVQRIAVEEQMLINLLGEEYVAYKEKSWKLIPFII